MSGSELPVRGRGQHAGLDQEAILSAALSLLEEAGGLTVRGLAERLDVRPFSISNRFEGGLDELLCETIRFGLCGLSQKNSGSWSDDLAGLVKRLASALAGRPTFAEHVGVILAARPSEVPEFVTAIETIAVAVSPSVLARKRSAVAMRSIVVGHVMTMPVAPILPSPGRSRHPVGRLIAAQQSARWAASLIEHLHREIAYLSVKEGRSRQTDPAGPS